MNRNVKTAVKRQYDTTSRQIAARTTRRRIIDAARTLFLERGYVRTTMPAIAAAAGVSVETLYLSVGPKAALVRYLIEVALSGTDEPIPAWERPGVAEVHAEPDPKRKVRMFARIVRQLQERLAPIWTVVLEAAPGDSELASLVTELRQRHARTMRGVVEHLATAGRLRSGVSVDVAADTVWAMNSPEFYGLLVRGRGWSGDKFERWLANAWVRLLFD